MMSVGTRLRVVSFPDQLMAMAEVPIGSVCDCVAEVSEAAFVIIVEEYEEANGERRGELRIVNKQ